ncbi:hypothetical protein D3C87_1312330 [compost metagenome]
MSTEIADAERAGAADIGLQHPVYQKPGAEHHRPAEKGPDAPAGALQRAQPDVADQNDEGQKCGQFR